MALSHQLPPRQPANERTPPSQRFRTPPRVAPVARSPSPSSHPRGNHHQHSGGGKRWDGAHHDHLLGAALKSFHNTVGMNEKSRLSMKKFCLKYARWNMALRFIEKLKNKFTVLQTIRFILSTVLFDWNKAFQVTCSKHETSLQFCNTLKLLSMILCLFLYCWTFGYPGYLQTLKRLLLI